MPVAIPSASTLRLQAGPLVLRPAQLDDAEQLARWSAAETDPWSPLPTGASADFWRAVIGANSGVERTWLIEVDLRPVGVMNVGPADNQQLVVEIGGYWVAPAERGRGVAAAAIRRLTEHLSGAGGFHRVQVFTRPDNYASRRAAEHAGFQQEGILRSFVQVAGERSDAVLLAWVRNSLEASS